MPPEAKKYLFDMQQAVRHILGFVTGVTLDAYKSDLKLRSAVERQFQIVGEALFRLNGEFPDIAQRITDYRAIIHFRHVLVHGYDSIRDEIVWGIIEKDLFKLDAELTALLA